MSSPLFIVLGAGRSAGWVIEQLSKQAEAGLLRLCVVDGLKPTYALSAAVEFRQAALSDEYAYVDLLQGAFCCISLLPPPMHPAVMEGCLAAGVHFISASYESAAARSHVAEAEAKGLMILNECGLDPGLDHVTALAMLKRVEDKGGKVLSFESDCGGLPSRRDLNDWGYRFFWNPMNVVTAGAAGARFHLEGQTRLIAYPEVFKQYRPLFAEEGRELVAYANRDSVPYQALYGLEHVDSFLRGTIRYRDYCDRWAALAEAGVANTLLMLEADMRFADWAGLFAWHPKASELLGDLVAETSMGNVMFGRPMTSADALLQVLMGAWNPESGYLDRVLMRHRIVYELDGQKHEYSGTLDIEGTVEHSAMSFTVGLPIAIMAGHLLGHSMKGVLTPMNSGVWPTIYGNLSKFGIELTYEHVILR